MDLRATCWRRCADLCTTAATAPYANATATTAAAHAYSTAASSSAATTAAITATTAALGQRRIGRHEY